MVTTQSKRLLKILTLSREVAKFLFYRHLF